jgi:glycosyltransferase involved in cell wall biosynthesis
LLNAEDGICAIPASDSVCLKCCVKTVPGWKFWYSLLRIAPLNLRLWAGKAIRKLPFIPFVTPLGIVSCSIRDKRREVSDIGLNAIRIIAPSPAMAEALFRNGVPRKKVAIVPHGIPSMPGFPLPDDFFGRALRFVFVGRISYVKGLHVLLKACQGLAPESYELHIVGSAATKQDKRYHNGLLKRFPVDNIIWHGGMANHEVSEVLRYCDVMVHPAICLEVFGLTIAEALSAGRPVIATRCGGAEIQVRDGENGLLVPPNDPVALRESMQRVIDDRDFLRAVAQRTGEVNSIEAHVRDLEKIYQEVLP